MSAAREEILGRVSAAVHGARSAPAEPLPRDYRRHGARSRAELVALFCERVDDYRAQVLRVPAGSVAGAVTDACRTRDARRLVVPPGLPTAWRPQELTLVEDGELS